MKINKTKIIVVSILWGLAITFIFIQDPALRTIMPMVCALSGIYALFSNKFSKNKSDTKQDDK